MRSLRIQAPSLIAHQRFVEGLETYEDIKRPSLTVETWQWRNDRGMFRRGGTHVATETRWLYGFNCDPLLTWAYPGVQVRSRRQTWRPPTFGVVLPPVQAERLALAEPTV